MYMFSSTIKDLLVKAEEAYNTQDAFRYKVKNGNDDGKKETCIESRSYTMLKTDSEKFSNMLAEYGEDRLCNGCGREKKAAEYNCTSV